MSGTTPLSQLAEPRLEPEDRGADGPIGRLADANHRARQDSRAVLSDLLNGYDMAEVAQRADGGTFAVGQQPVDLSRFMQPDGLLEVLSSHDVGGGRIKVLKDNEQRDPVMLLDHLNVGGEFGRAPGGRLWSALHDGYTLIMDAIDLRDRTLTRLSEHVSRVFACPLNINAYISYRASPSFGPHWDSHDVLILHLLGHKRWKVHEPITLSPHKELYEQFETGAPMWEGVIGPGDFLYLPRGWGHDVLGVDELTCHLTVTIPRPLLTDVVAASLGRPVTSADDLALVDPSRPPDARAVSATVRRALGESDIDTTVRALRASLTSRPAQALPLLVGALDGSVPRHDLWVRAPHPGGVFLATDGGGAQHVVFGGRTVPVELVDLEVVAPLLDGRVHLAGRSEAAAPSPSTARDAIDQALRVGLLETVADPRAWGMVEGDNAA